METSWGMKRGEKSGFWRRAHAKTLNPKGHWGFGKSGKFCRFALCSWVVVEKMKAIVRPSIFLSLGWFPLQVAFWEDGWILEPRDENSAHYPGLGRGYRALDEGNSRVQSLEGWRHKALGRNVPLVLGKKASAGISTATSRAMASLPGLRMEPTFLTAHGEVAWGWLDIEEEAGHRD